MKRFAIFSLIAAIAFTSVACDGQYVRTRGGTRPAPARSN